MQKIIFPVIAIILFYGSCAQASISKPTNAEIEVSVDKPLLKQLIHILHKPNYHSKEDGIDNFISYMDSLRLMNLDEQLRMERGLKDIFQKIKSFFEKLFKKGKKAVSRSVRQAPEPNKPEAGGEDKKEGNEGKEGDKGNKGKEGNEGKEGKAEKESDLKLVQKIRQFLEEVKKAFMKIFSQK